MDTSAEFSNALLTFATAPKAAGGLGLTLSNSRNVIELISILQGVNVEGIKSFALFSNGEEIFGVFAALPEINFRLFGLEIGRVPKIIDILVIVPVLNVALQWGSMKLMRKWSITSTPAPAQDAQSQASMKIMDLVLPLMTLFIMFQVPALIGIYWLFRSFLSLIKSFIMKTVMPVPKYTDEEIREMEKAQRAAALQTLLGQTSQVSQFRVGFGQKGTSNGFALYPGL
jgi:membrane protein insertase Oxa1/YidC/SpoIIIJ